MAIGSELNNRSGRDVLTAAMSQLGKPYIWGGGRNGDTSGFDCSGFVTWAYSQMGINLPAFTDAAFDSAEPIATGDSPRPGDLVFFDAPDPHQPGVRYSHMGIYAGSGLVIDANSGDGAVGIHPLSEYRGSAIFRRPTGAQPARPLSIEAQTGNVVQASALEGGNTMNPPKGWEEVQGTNGQIYWRNQSTGQWYDPVSKMLQDGKGGWVKYDQPIIGTDGQPATPKPQPQSGSTLPATGKKGVPFYLRLPNGQVQQYDWIDPGESYIDENDNTVTTSTGGWKRSGSPIYPTDQTRIPTPSEQLAKDKFDYDKGQDALANDAKKAELEYKKQRDKILDTRYDQEWKRQADLDALDAWYKGEQNKLSQRAADLADRKAKLDEDIQRGQLANDTQRTTNDTARVGIDRDRLMGRDSTGRSTLERELGEAESGRRDVDINLKRQDQAFNQEMARREEAIKLAQNPESELASAYLHAGLTPPAGSLMAEILAKTGKRTPDVELFLEGQKRGGVEVDQWGNEIPRNKPGSVASPGGNATPPWYAGMDNAAIEEKLRQDPSLLKDIPDGLLSTFNNQLLLDLGLPALSRLSPERIAGTGAFAGAGFSPEVQQWVASQGKGTPATGSTAGTPATTQGTARGTTQGTAQAPSTGIGAALTAPTPAPTPASTTLGNALAGVDTTPAPPPALSISSTAGTPSTVPGTAPGTTPAGLPLPSIPANGFHPGETGINGHTPGFSPGADIPLPEGTPTQAGTTPLGAHLSAMSVSPNTNTSTDTLQAGDNLSGPNITSTDHPISPPITRMPQIRPEEPNPATPTNGVIQGNVFGKPTIQEIRNGIGDTTRIPLSPTNPANPASPAAPATPPAAPGSATPQLSAYTDPRRRFLRQGQRSELAGHIASGAVRPQLSKILNKEGALTGTGTSELSSSSGRVPNAFRPTGGMRVLSAQDRSKLRSTDLKSLSGLSQALGNNPEDYLGETDRRNGGARR